MHNNKVNTLCMCARLCACTHAQRVHVYNKEL